MGMVGGDTRLHMGVRKVHWKKLRKSWLQSQSFDQSIARKVVGRVSRQHAPRRYTYKVTNRVKETKEKVITI
jgi:hypothetical protein